MTPEQVDRVFGCGRLKMATGEHVEVFREAVAPGERRRYTKRFLATRDGDFGPWTEREWRILARLIGHGVRSVPDVVQFDGGAMGGSRLVQTYDAGITVDQWATLLPVARDRAAHRHVFEDCAHWWALAHHCLAALNEIHALDLVHLDIKADNICIPYGPADFDPDSPGHRLHPVFARLALIDFAFSVVSRESLATPLPIGWQKDYDYQSPRLLKALEAGRNGDLEPTKELDWRCDFYSLAAMLKRYLPANSRAHPGGDEGRWTAQRYDDARNLIFRLRDSHDRDLPHWRPHSQLMDFTGARLDEHDLAVSLAHGWTLARDAVAAGMVTPITPITPVTRMAGPQRPAAITPMTRIAQPERDSADIAMIDLAVMRHPRVDPARVDMRIVPPTAVTTVSRVPPPRLAGRVQRASRAMAMMVLALVALAAPPFIGEPQNPRVEPERAADVAARAPAIAPAPAVPDAAAPAQDASAAASAPAQEQVAAASAPVEAPAAAAVNEPAAQGGETRVEPPSPTSQADGTAPPGATARTKAGGAANRSQAAKRSSTAASANAAPRRVPPTALASAATARADPRQAPSRNTPAQPASPPVQVAAATVMPSSPQPAMSLRSLSSASSGAAPDPAVAPSSAVPIPAPATDQAGTANGNRPASAPSAAATPAPAGGVETTARDQRSATPAPKQPRAKQPPPRDEWHNLIETVFGMFRNRGGPAAPIEERSVQASPAARPAAAPRAPARPAPDLLAQAAPAAPAVPRGQGNAAAAIPAPAAIAASAAAPIPLGAPVPLTIETVVTASPAPVVATSPPAAEPPRARPVETTNEVWTMQARRALAETVPRIAAQAQPDVSRVMWAANQAEQPFQAQAVVDAASTRWASEYAPLPASNVAPAYARLLHNDAWKALASGRDVSDAVNLELQAFGANPGDADIAGYLAFLHLRMKPVQAETARQLAMHAIAISGARRPTRSDDWGTLAVASALTGRDTDAVRAYLAEIALTNNVDRTCRSALSAYASFGERLRVPVQAMLYRVHTLGRGYAPPSCAWPPYWNAAARSPGAY